ncbi:MAG: glycine cleavage system protein GcvH [Sedimentisphaerales bacterium]|nr:glycine cleavage system protein GcvH [Sedimentisphaerales bacterium]
MVPEGLYYTKEHEWTKVAGDTATIGITDHAQEQLGEITFADLPAVGDKLSAGTEFASVESSKAASDVYSPIAGEVVEVNSALDAKPELINDDCYGQGWICKARITDKSGLDKLMDAKKYEDYLKGL